MDGTCSESGLSGRAKGMGDQDDLTKEQERVADGEDGRASSAEGEKSSEPTEGRGFGKGSEGPGEGEGLRERSGTAEGKGEETRAGLPSRVRRERVGSRGMNANGGTENAAEGRQGGRITWRRRRNFANTDGHLVMGTSTRTGRGGGEII